MSRKSVSLKVEYFIGHQQPSTGNMLQPFFSVT